MNNKRWLLRIYFMLVISVWTVESLAKESLLVSDAWIPEAPPHAEVSAAYLTIHNQTNQVRKFVGVSSPQFQKAELHQSIMVDGQERMRRISALTVEANGSVVLKPGGYHLMLIKPLQPLKAGDFVDLKLQFDDKSQITARVPIRNIDDIDKAPHHHDMGDMKM
jgi:periplasmic copper chaperone A